MTQNKKLKALSRIPLPSFCVSLFSRMNRTLVVLSLTLAASMARAETAQSVLARMDAGAAKFHSMSADVKITNHTAILNDDTTEPGTVKMERGKDETRALMDFTGEKDRRTIAFLDKSIQIYYPALNLVQVYKLGKKSKLVDQYLLLGFGTSGKDLSKGYEITVAGSEKIDGKDATKLELIPKDKGLKEQIQKVDIWLPIDSGYPIQQQFYNPSGNYRLATYSNFQLNPSFGEGALKLVTPPGVKIEYPQ